MTGLHAACASGEVGVISLLIEAKASLNAVNNAGNTPLHTTCLNGHETVAARLIRAGANIKARNHKGQVCRCN